MKGRRVFISGGNGVIGNELVRLLTAQGAEICVGDLKPRPLDWPASVRYRQGDLNFITKNELDDFAPEIFFHLAATSGRSTKDYEFWEENYQNNVRLSHYLLTQLRDFTSLRKVVFPSSYLIYDPKNYMFDRPQQRPHTLTEGDSIYPRSLTGVAKLTHEIELRFLSEFRGSDVDYVSARIYRSFGLNSRDVISRWVRALLRRETIEVWGEESYFDYIFARDVADGLARIAASKTKVPIINLGSGQSRRVADVVACLKKHFPGSVIVNKPYSGPYEASQANMKLAEGELGWRPKYSLEDAISEIVAFEKKREGRIAEASASQGHFLVTSISKKIPLLKAVRNAALKIGPETKVFGGDVDPQCLGRYFVDEFWEMPPLDKLNATNIVTYCQAHRIRCIVPTRDGELGFWSGLKPTLAAQGIHVMVSDQDAIKASVDKLEFAHKMVAAGLPSIPTEKNIENLKATQFVVKERFGAGARGLGINLSSTEAIAHGKNLEAPIFQPFIEGSEVSVDLYADKKGVVKGVICRRRDVVVAGESQVTTTFRDSTLESLSSQLATRLGLYGHIVLQALKQNKGEWIFIEANARFGGASTLGLAAGLDSFYWTFLESEGQNLAEYPFFRARTEKKQVRYPSDLVIDDHRV